MATQLPITSPQESTSEFEVNSDKPKAELQVHSDAEITKRKSVDPKDGGMEDPKPFRLMDLPRELRDAVYRELLSPGKVRRSNHRPGEKIRLYAMQPAILRACKQTYNESLRVLYKETNWVLITTSENVEDGIISGLKKRGYPFTVVQGPLCFPGTPVLLIKMSSSFNVNHEYQSFMVIPQQDFEIIGKFLLNHSQASMALRFDQDAMQNASTREALLHCCRDFRGTHCVTIEGLDPIDRAILVTVMTTPIRHFEEYIERAKAYQQHADHQLAQRRFWDSFRANWAGHLYVRWAWDVKFAVRQRESPVLTLQQITKLKEREVEFLIASAYCRTKTGNPKKARTFLDKMLTHDERFPSPTKQQEIQIHYHKALTFVAERDDIQAACEFRVVLSQQPGHEGADEQIEAMNARLQTMPQTKRCEIEAFLKDVVKPHRHRKPGSARLSEEAMPVDGLSNMVI